MEINDYVFSADDYTINVPQINVDLNSVSQDELLTIQSEYLANAEVYSESYANAYSNINYVKNRFMKDLAGQNIYLLENGINKAENKISLHVKTDNVFKLAMGDMTLSNVSNINVIINNFNNLY